MPLLPQSEIKAITKLLKTTDEGTLKLLEEQLKTFDTKLLREINNEIPRDDVELSRQFNSLLQKIKREELKKEFASWTRSNLNDLEKGIFLIALFDNPLLDVEQYLSILNNWTITLSRNLQKIKVKDDPTSVINEVNHFLFMELGFKGNKDNYYDPDNSFINKVMDKKLGNPILLSVIYLIITKKLNLPFSGVNMPAHFLIQYNDAFDPIYVDPFNQGEIITKLDCQERIKILKLSWQDDYLTGPTNKQIIARTLQNLINIYHNDGLFELKDCLEDYLKMLGRLVS